jgi:hypothetical protein
MTWEAVQEESETICAAWYPDGATELVALAERIRIGWSRYHEAVRAGEEEASHRVLDKIHVLELQAWEQDTLARRLLLLRGLLVLRSLAGPKLVVMVDAPGESIRVRP